MVAVRQLRISKIKFLTVGTVQRVNMRHPAKVRGSRSKRCSDKAFFFKMAAILDLLCVFGQPTNSSWWYLSPCNIWLDSMK